MKLHVTNLSAARAEADRMHRERRVNMTILLVILTCAAVFAAEVAVDAVREELHARKEADRAYITLGIVTTGIVTTRDYMFDLSITDDAFTCPEPTEPPPCRCDKKGDNRR